MIDETLDIIGVEASRAAEEANRRAAEKLARRYSYHISFVKTSGGGMHDHHDYGNTVIKQDHPLTERDLNVIRNELRSRSTNVSNIAILGIFQLHE